MDIDLALVAVAVLVGGMVGLTGVGAGALMTPILIGGFGVSAAVAIATDLLFATVTKIIGVVIHGRAGRVDWKVSRSLWTGSIPGVLLGSALLVGLVVTGAGEWLTWLIVVVVGVTSFTLLRRALVGRSRAAHPHTAAPPWLAPVGGAGIGIGVSLTSVGAGVLGMALLVRLSPRDTAPQRCGRDRSPARDTYCSDCGSELRLFRTGGLEATRDSASGIPTRRHCRVNSLEVCALQGPQSHARAGVASACPVPGCVGAVLGSL